MGKTTIQIEEKTRDRLLHTARKSQTYDDILNELIDIKEGMKK